MRLPPELIDLIFSHLSLDELQTLRNCSLVARSWAHRSQKRLFETVQISRLTYSSWVEGISPENLELLRHVHSLTLSITGPRCPVPTSLIDDLGDYLPSLHNLKSLVLSSLNLESGSPKVENFSAFRLTLSSLSIWRCYVSTGAFIILVNYFPNLVDLQLRSPLPVEDYKPVPPLLRPLRGRLSAEGFNDHTLLLLNHLSNLPPELDELATGGTGQGTIGYDHMVAAYVGSVKRLRLLHGFYRRSRFPHGPSMLTKSELHSGGPPDPLPLPETPRTRAVRDAPDAKLRIPHHLHHLHEPPEDSGLCTWFRNMVALFRS